uniref:Uncharacterized protein n=1 Tax=Tetranychus urticae TaxID=32264 RepID=T1K9P0_TETUR
MMKINNLCKKIVQRRKPQLNLVTKQGNN